MTSSTNTAFSKDALFGKSQVFINRGYRAKQENEEEEYQLWASLALELLAKSTLSSFHPALVADPSHFQSLFAACGVTKELDVKTVTASTLYKRSRKLSKVFDHRVGAYCEQLSIRRNCELHSGQSPFSGMNRQSWENHFWHAVDTLLTMQNKDLSDWISPAEATSKKRFLQEVATARAMAIKARIDDHRKDFEYENKDTAKRDQVIADSQKTSPWTFSKRFSFNIDSYEAVTCRACGSNGVVGGIFWDEEIIEKECYDDECPTELVDKHYVVEEFWCSVCRLHLDGTLEIEAANLDSEFTCQEVREIEFEPDYGND